MAPASDALQVDIARDGLVSNVRSASICVSLHRAHRGFDPSILAVCLFARGLELL